VDETEQLETNTVGSMDMNDSSMDFSLSSKKKKKKRFNVDVDEEKQGLQLHCTKYHYKPLLIFLAVSNFLHCVSKKVHPFGFHYTEVRH